MAITLANLDNSVAEPSKLEDTLIPWPYLLFLGDTVEPGYAKTAFGLRDWARDKCVGELVLPLGTVSAGLPAMSPDLAKAAGAKSLVIGVANPGGVIPATWTETLVAALAAGLDIVSGMHGPLAANPILREAAERHGQQLIDVRHPPESIPVANGRKRTGMRLLTVGTDCALGKKYTALSIARNMIARGIDCDFRASGQTGIMIAGAGIPIDSVVADFISGAAEMLSPEAAPTHWDIIEGQGSLFHPAYAGVSLGLLHGSQPDVIIVCHEPGRLMTLGNPGYPIPSIEQVIDTNLLLGRRTNSAIRCGGVALNTAAMGMEEAAELCAAESKRLGLPVADPIRGGSAFEALVEACVDA